MIDLKRLQQLLETLRKGPITPAIVKEIQQINSQIQQHQQSKKSQKQKKKSVSYRRRRTKGAGTGQDLI